MIILMILMSSDIAHGGRVILCVCGVNKGCSCKQNSPINSLTHSLNPASLSWFFTLTLSYLPLLVCHLGLFLFNLRLLYRVMCPTKSKKEAGNRRDKA